MIQELIAVLGALVIFACLAYALYWICTKFFPGLQPALWICGVLLIIILLYAITRFPGGLSHFGS